MRPDFCWTSFGIVAVVGDVDVDDVRKSSLNLGSSAVGVVRCQAC